jgi:OTU domain-containing protein 3
MGKNKGEKGRKEKCSKKAVAEQGPAATSKKEERSKRTAMKKQRAKKRNKATYGVDEFDLQLRTIGCRVNEMEPDGNCLFRSLSDQIAGDASGHRDLRQRIIDYVETNRDDFEPFMEDDEPFDDYVDRMREDGEWGGNQELCAAARLLNRQIIIHQFQAPRMELSPFTTEPEGTLHVCYRGENHYDSVRAVDDKGDGMPKDIMLNGVVAPREQSKELSEQEEKLLDRCI